MVPSSRRLLGALALAAFVTLPAGAQANNMGPDWVASDNVELLTRIKTVGDGVGAVIVGKYLYVTTTKSLSIFDIQANPENPPQIGLDTMDVEFENEEVPTNGKILGISGQIGCADPASANALNMTGEGTDATNTQSSLTGCLTLYDVSDPAAPKKLTSVSGAGQHTSACIFDCTWFYGSAGAITDARDPANAKLVGTWSKALPPFKASCHHLREIKPGVLLGSCQPIVLLSVRPEDGASLLKPVILDTGTNEDNRFIHSSRWPRHGQDKFLLVGGETNAQPQCDDTVGAFTVWDAGAVRDGKGDFLRNQQFKILDQVRPINGQYIDGHSPYNGLGCSVHWFEEHPSFHDGGLVALAEYENGERFLQIKPDGKIVEQGFFLPLGGSTSAPHWNPFNPQILYSIDYGRGVDVLKYTGATYVPDITGTPTVEPGSTPGTNGAGPGTAAGANAGPCASAAGFKSVTARAKGRGLLVRTSRAKKIGFRVELFQQSSGRKVLDNRLRARKTSLGDSLTVKSKKFTDGYYFLRLIMKYNGGKDTRRLTLLRSHGKFRIAPDFYQRTDCGAFRSYKLSSSVFGGAAKKSLGIAYRLARGADRVRLFAKVGSKTIKTWVGAGDTKTHRFTLPASAVKRGKAVKITAQVEQGSPIATQNLTAKRL